MARQSKTIPRTQARPDLRPPRATRPARRGAPWGSVARIAAFALVSAFVFPGPALAQALNATAREGAVGTRARTDFQPHGLELGTLLSPLMLGHTSETLNAFTVSPRFEVVQEFNDNVFNRADRAEADKIIHYKPALSINGEWENHGLNVFFEADRGRYYQKRSQNYLDYSVGTKTRLDMAGEGQITGNYTFFRKHDIGNEPLDIPTASSGSSAFGQQILSTSTRLTLYDQHLFEIGSVMSTDPVLARVEAGARRTAYHATKLDSGLDSENQDRNYWEMVVTPRLGYETFEDTVLFIEPRYAERFYDAKFDRGGTNNNSREYQMLTGVTYDFSDLTFAEVGIGVVHNRYDDRRFKPSTGFTFDSTIIWNATDLTTFTFRAVRSNLATTDTQTKTVATTFLSAGWDWEVLDNLVFSVLGGWAKSDFLQDQPIINADGSTERERVDHQVTFQVGFRYYMNEYITAKADYIHLDRTSNKDANKLTKRRWLVGLAAQL
jgi:hypothetical protein